MTRQRGQRHLSMISIVEERGDGTGEGDSSAHDNTENDDQPCDQEEQLLVDANFSRSIVMPARRRADTFEESMSCSMSSATSFGLPSLSSINYDSVATDFESVQSSIHGYQDSVVSFEDDDDYYDDGDDDIDEQHDTWCLAPDPCPVELSRAHLQNLSLEVRTAAAKTIEVLSPIRKNGIWRKNAWDFQSKRWGTCESPKNDDIMGDPVEAFPSSRDGAVIDTEDDDPVPSYSVRSRSIDFIPSMPQRPIREFTQRVQSLDRMPFLPRRQVSNRNLEC